MGKIINKMRVVMAEKRMSVKKLSELTGRHRNTITNLRDGTPTVRLDTLEDVCNALECTPSDILVWVEDDE